MLISASTVSLTNCSLYLHGLRLQGELAEPCCIQRPHPEHIFLSRHQSVADEPADFPFRITFITGLAKVLTRFLPGTIHRFVVAWLPHIAAHNAALNVVANQLFSIAGGLPGHNHGRICVSGGDHSPWGRWDICGPECLFICCLTVAVMMRLCTILRSDQACRRRWWPRWGLTARPHRRSCSSGPGSCRTSPRRDRTVQIVEI